MKWKREPGKVGETKGGRERETDKWKDGGMDVWIDSEMVER